MEVCLQNITGNVTLETSNRALLQTTNIASQLQNLWLEVGPNCTAIRDKFLELLSTNGTTSSTTALADEDSFEDYEDSSATEDEGGSSTEPFRMPYSADVAWTVVFSIMIVSAIVGNLVVFWIVLGHRRMQNVTNYFLVNLSCADLMMSCLNTVFNFIFMKSRDWIFGSVYCTINNFIAYMSVAVSVFTLMAISIDRYIAIVRPLKPRMSKTCARIFLLVIWLSSALLSLPSLLYSKTWTFAYGDGENLTVCFLLWPDGPPTVSKLDYIYNIVYFFLTYIVPIVAMGICYGQIGSVLWGKGIIRENACNDLAHERKLLSKRKVVKMFIVVVIIFAVCWLPYHVYFIYTYHHKEVVTMPFIQHVYLGFYWLAMANAMFNPLIYYWMNARFRGYFKALMSSARLVCCQPGRFLFRRTNSKSSLDIGVRPVDRGVVKMELHHYTNRLHPGMGKRLQNANIQGASSEPTNRHLNATGLKGNGAGPLVVGSGSGDVMSPPGGAMPNFSSNRKMTSQALFRHLNNHTSSDIHSEPAINRMNISYGPNAGLLPISGNLALSTPGGANGVNCCSNPVSISPLDGTTKATICTALNSIVAPTAVNNLNTNSSSSDFKMSNCDHEEPVLRISVPFRNNPLLKHTSLQ